MKLPQALAIIPPDDVILAFEKIKNQLENVDLGDDLEVELVKIRQFYSYFENNFIGPTETITKGRGRNKTSETVRRAPRYAIGDWSVYDRTKENIPKTNNFVEAWHNAFQKNIKSHPGIYELVDYMRVEQRSMEAKLIKLRTGVVPARKQAYDIQNERIINILRTYTKEDFEDFYDRLSLILHY